MRYTQNMTIPWAEYTKWYEDINKLKKQELSNAFDKAALLGSTAYTQYKAEQQKQNKRDDLEQLYKAAGIMNEDGTWDTSMDDDEKLKKLLAIRTFGAMRE